MRRSMVFPLPARREGRLAWGMPGGRRGRPAPPGDESPGYESNEKPGEPGSGSESPDRVRCTLKGRSGMPYWQLFYHAVWATRFRERVLGPEVDPFAHDLSRHKAMDLGAVVHSLNGMEDHIHLVISLPPKIAPAFFIGQVKGASSTRLNQSRRLDRPFSW